MSVKQTNGSHKFKISKKQILLFVFVALLFVNFSFMGASLAKYVSEVNFKSDSINSGIYEFNIDGDGEISASTTIGGATLQPDSPDDDPVVPPADIPKTSARPMSISVSNLGEFKADGVVTLETERILPLIFAMYANGSKIEATTSIDGVYTYRLSLVPGEDVVFDLYVYWTDGAYDERLSGLSEDIFFSAIFEQAGD